MQVKNKLILHIPHSSANIPFTDGFVVDDIALKAEILKLTDWYTDELFYSDEDCMIRAEFSRIFCDPERFEDDSQEVMAQYGMGVLYEKSDAGKIIRQLTPELRKSILSGFYRKHHKALAEAVNAQLGLSGKALIVDCHSYPSVPLMRDLDQNPDRPDFNIGTDSFHTPKELIDLSVEFFERKGYSLGVDWPYSGSIVPLEHYGKTSNVRTIMLEINRRLYLNEPENEKSERFGEIQNVVQDYMKELKLIE